MRFCEGLLRLEPLIAEKFEMKGSEKSRQSLLDEVMSFVLLGKNKFGLHSLLRFLGIGTIIVLNYLFNHSWLEYNLLEFENIAYYIPIFAINLWSMIVSFRKEIYMQ